MKEIEKSYDENYKDIRNKEEKNYGFRSVRTN